jgi:hypothetical protein
MISLPLTPQAKHAGIGDVGLAALLGLVYGSAARQIPVLAQARLTNPNLYDAALGAAVATTLEAIEDHHEESVPRSLPGQSAGAGIPPPAWNLL